MARLDGKVAIITGATKRHGGSGASVDLLQTTWREPNRTLLFDVVLMLSALTQVSEQRGER